MLQVSPRKVLSHRTVYNNMQASGYFLYSPRLAFLLFCWLFILGCHNSALLPCSVIALSEPFFQPYHSGVFRFSYSNLNYGSALPRCNYIHSNYVLLLRIPADLRCCGLYLFTCDSLLLTDEEFRNLFNSIHADMWDGTDV